MKMTMARKAYELFKELNDLHWNNRLIKANTGQSIKNYESEVERLRKEIEDLEDEN